MLRNWQYLNRREIDDSKWNRCIENSENGQVYALSEYLDHTTQHWDALIYGDYEAVMPLPWKKKFGIQYVFAPPFVQHLGIFGTGLDPKSFPEAIRIASARFRWIDYRVNYFLANVPAIIRRKQNYILHLARGYKELYAGYTTQCVINLQKAARRGCRLDEGIPVSEVIRLFRLAYGGLHTASENEYQRFEALMNTPQHFKVHSYGVREQNSNELLFGALVVQFRNRLYYAMGAPTTKGRNARATYFFIDQLFQQFAGSKMIFDFEGSELPNVADFYQRFGPEKEEYLHLTVNRLPWFLKLFKS
ncbi:MAG TPA: hypothetical protein VLC28_03050 [Flavitalea sp.]|nr:hypothetical protein [Flavitalea sp.]